MANKNLSYQLGKLLMNAATEHIAPNAVADIAYDKIYLATNDEQLASELSDMMQSLAQFVEPPADDN